MSNQKTSPGPWTWGYAGEDGHMFETDVLYGADGYPVGVNADDYSRQKAHKTRFNENAALIADAPAMLDMLDAAWKQIDLLRTQAFHRGIFSANEPSLSIRALLDKHGRTP